MEPQIKRSVLSVSWEADIQPNPFEGLLYKIEPSKKLKLAGRVGNVLMLSESGSTGPLQPREARYVVGNSVDSKAVDDLRPFSERRAAAIATLKNVKPLSGRDLTVDELKAYELIAEADDQKTDLPIRLYQIIAADKNGYFIIQGLVPADRAQEFIAEFQKLTKSFHRVNR